MLNLPNGPKLSHYKNFDKNLHNQAVSTNSDDLDDTIPLAEPYDPILPKQNNQESYISATYTIKVIFLGDTNTGKTCAMYSLQNNVHMETPASTIGVEFASIKRHINNMCFKYNIWDTAGQEKYRSITHSFFKNSGIELKFLF